MVLAGVLYLCGSAKVLYKNEEMKSKQLEMAEETKAKIQEEGLYHVTTKEAAQAIMESGFLFQ